MSTTRRIRATTAASEAPGKPSTAQEPNEPNSSTSAKLVKARWQTGYKLFRRRRDGSYGPLFINCKQRLEIGVAYPAESHRTPGYAFRPGWHVCSEKRAPHLSKVNRVWCKVQFKGATKHLRPDCQGGLWYTAMLMRIVEEVPGD